MNEFGVEFTENTTFDQMEAGLDAVSAIDRVQEDETWFFSAEWGTTQRDLNNLKGKIETGSGRGSVSDIGLQGDSKQTKK
ncbi:MAG: hypothetical protein ACSHXI_02640 [Hoeflea sp.]|uniref:hypothetical protein n=1 Tax=Hoeflea sp. TaxID=1940281 RepID=UPI003EF2C00C